LRAVALLSRASSAAFVGDAAGLPLGTAAAAAFLTFSWTSLR
jgi:hypothetical protein